jgi:hypothetical protein
MPPLPAQDPDPWCQIGRAWLDALDLRAHKDVVVVATANKLARSAWAVLLPAPDNDPTHTLRLRDLPLA